MGFIPTLKILQAAQTALRAAVLTEPAALAGQPAFAAEAVRIYEHEDLLKAMGDLLIFEDRAAFLIPVAVKHDNQLEGRGATSLRTVEFACLLTDRVYADFDAAASTGDAQTVGCMRLSELVIATLTAGDAALGLPSVCVQPTDGEPFALPKEAPAGRDAWAQLFSTPAGDIRIDRGRPRART